MALQGDLSTFQLADLLQSLETNAKSGTLTVEGVDGQRRLYFAEGRLSLFSYAERPTLVQVLVACALVTPRQLEAAKKKRRGSRKSLGAVLVEQRRLSTEQLHEIAEARLLDEACELVAAENDAFRFDEGGVPRGLFDPEERRLRLEIAAGPLLMESARREDHWRLIRMRVPSDSAHYLVHREPPKRQGKGDQEAEEDTLHAELMQRLDGTRSVIEAMARFPHRRFDAYQALAELIDAGTVRMARSEDMVALVRECAPKDPQRAWKLLDRALATAPQARELLVQRALLGEDLGQLEAATEALKILAHLHLEGGETEEARERLADAKRLASRDTAVWERSYKLAIEEERFEDALADGRHLAELYRSPGLHRKAWKVFETLVGHFPEEWELRLELARSQGDSGEITVAVEGLLEHGRRALARGADAQAKHAFQEVLRFDATRDDVREKVERIDAGFFARRRARLRRFVRWVTALALLGGAGWVGWQELQARNALSAAEERILQAEWIESKDYGRAVEALETVRHAHPWTTTALFDVPRRVAGLRAKPERGAQSSEEAKSSSMAPLSGASGHSDR